MLVLVLNVELLTLGLDNPAYSVSFYLKLLQVINGLFGTILVLPEKSLRFVEKVINAYSEGANV